MTIAESSLYADLHVETSPVQATASWTDHIATVRDVSVSRGGYEPFAGINEVQPGSGTITLVDNSATILPGYWVKVRYQSAIIWAGYIQDVQITYSNVGGQFYQRKTLVVLDWAAWVAQYSVSNLSAYQVLYLRNAQINGQIGNNVITPNTGSLPPATFLYSALPDSRTVAEVLNMSTNSTATAWWRPELAIPTGSSGITSIIKTGTTITAQNVALTDGTHTGSPTGLTYYSDIEVATRTSQVVNNVRINNTHVFSSNGITTGELSTGYSKSDSTSVGLYGSRYAECDANAFLTIGAINLINDPSFEASTYNSTSTNFVVSAEQPSQDAGGAWSAYNGNWAMRSYNTTGAGTAVDLTEDERIFVTAGTTYYVFGYGATTGTTSIRVRTSIKWYNEAGTLLSTSYGSFVSCSVVKTWYKATGSAAAPAGATNARVALYFDRNGSAFPATSKVWADGMYFGTANETNWFNGDTADTATNIYDWVGSQNASWSYRATNAIDTLATQFLTDNATAKYSPYTIRLNAQANLAKTTLFNLYESIYVWFQSHRWTSVVTGIQHNITINSDGTTRWMVDLIVRPSTYTI